MKTKIILKSISYWSSVIIIGIIFGFALQFAKAWTEPTGAAPTGNVGAPINTSGTLQNKVGSFSSSGSISAEGAVQGKTSLCIGSDCRNAWPSGGGTTYTPGTGISISGTTITNTGDTNAADDIITDSSSQNKIGSFGSSGSISAVGSVQGKTSLCIASDCRTAWPSSGTTYTPGTGISISGTTITNTLPGTTYTAGTGISISGNTITNTKTNDTVLGTGSTITLPTGPTKYKVLISAYFTMEMCGQAGIMGEYLFLDGSNIDYITFPSCDANDTRYRDMFVEVKEMAPGSHTLLIAASLDKRYPVTNTRISWVAVPM